MRLRQKGLGQRRHAIPELLSDDVLSERVLRGDHRALATLTARYWVAVHRVAWSMLPDRSMTGEVVEKTFVRVLFSPGWARRGTPFKVSLYRLAIDLSLAHHRPGPTLKSESLLPEFDAGGRLVLPEGGWPRLPEPSDLKERILEGLDHLESLDRAAFVLRAMEGVPLHEAAAILRTTSKTIRDRTHRACLLLTGFLAGRLHISL
jgi:DNA-directed RNA polymerase specialized sigma24 family protein